MKSLGMSLLIVVLGLSADDSAKDPSKADLEKMQGDWVAVTYVIDGNSLGEDDVQAYFRTIKGNEYKVARYRREIGKGTFKLDATKSPKTIDVERANAPAGTKPTLGIYAFDGNRLKLCFAPPGKDRPKEFISKEDSGYVLNEWEPEKK